MFSNSVKICFVMTIQDKEKIKENIIVEIAQGSNLNALGKLDAFPSRKTIYEWLADDEEFRDKYARAREDRADARADRIDDIVNDVIDGKIAPDVARVAIDTYKWQAGKEKPTRYGDKQTVDMNVNNFFDKAAP